MMTKPLGVTQFLSELPQVKGNKSPATESDVLTHVDQRLVAAAVKITQPRQMGKTFATEVSELVSAGESVIESISNGDFFNDTETSIDAADKAKARLNAALLPLKAKGF